jgi:hypothetical protein
MLIKAETKLETEQWRQITVEVVMELLNLQMVVAILVKMFEMLIDSLAGR